MAPLPDATDLAQLSIPGTHESAALYEPIVGTAKCQRLTLAEQLAIGVRYFDIRCRDISDAFAIYHGPESEMQTFDDVLATMFAFLDAHPSEAVIMSIKEEYTEENATQSFEATFDGYVAQAPDRWFLGDGVPALGDVRGKIVLLRRFTAMSPPLGLDASGWADDTTFTLTTAGAVMRVEDEYKVTTDDAKWAAITSALDAARAAAPADPTLYLTYTSGYQTQNGIPNITSVETVIDPELETYLTGTGPAHLGVIAMDFVDGGHASLIAATNGP